MSYLLTLPCICLVDNTQTQNKLGMKQGFLTFLFLIAALSASAQSAKVVGYLPWWRFYVSDQLEYCKLTHLNICFANPDSAGNLAISGISDITSDALADNPDIKICISLAGGALDAQQAATWSNLIDIPANRPAFISKIVNFVVENNLHGVDVDLEWDHVTIGYSDFVVELDAALTAQNKMLTAALPNQTLFENINADALAAFDFINIMSYDATGPWAPAVPGQHSSMEFAQTGISFWMDSVGIDGDKLTLGVPFYAYNFGDPGYTYALSYAEMVTMDPANAMLDQVDTIFYNGIPTIKAKVGLANSQVGGIMIWELGQDLYDQNSLLGAIHDEFTALNVLTTGLCGNTVGNDDLLGANINLYPNPADDALVIQTKIAGDIVIFDIMGRAVTAQKQVSDGSTIDVSSLGSGYYLLRLSTDAGFALRSFIKG
jgi:chitinase